MRALPPNILSRKDMSQSPLERVINASRLFAFWAWSTKSQSPLERVINASIAGFYGHLEKLC